MSCDKRCVEFGYFKDDLSVANKLIDIFRNAGGEAFIVDATSDFAHMSNIESQEIIHTPVAHKQIRLCGCSELKDKIVDELKEFTVTHDSDEGRRIIASGDHVQEIWEDGEETSTKGGKLFRMRTLHQRVPAVGIKFIDVKTGEHDSRVVKPEYSDIVHEILFGIYMLNLKKGEPIGL